MMMSNDKRSYVNIEQVFQVFENFIQFLVQKCYRKNFRFLPFIKCDVISRRTKNSFVFSKFIWNLDSVGRLFPEKLSFHLFQRVVWVVTKNAVGRSVPLALQSALQIGFVVVPLSEPWRGCENIRFVKRRAIVTRISPNQPPTLRADD